jgi:SAM-dependent methyltransferase
VHDVITGCRSCGSRELRQFLDLGKTPLADALVEHEALDVPENTYPLTVAFCPACSLVQILETVPPGELFGDDYPYFSSFSDALLEHSRHNVEALIESRRLGPDSLVVELASNDGYLLQYFQRAGIPVLGIDPAPGPAQAARDRGIPTLGEFFDADMALRLVNEGRSADVIIANNVLAHVPDQNRFVEGMAALLATDGQVVVEVPYVKDLIDHSEFDTIYHEHHCYFSVTSIVALFGRHGLCLNHVEHHPIHGGSLRLFLGRTSEQSESVQRYLAEESGGGLTAAEYYEDFAARVEGVRVDLRSMLRSLKREGNRIAAYGAAAKGATLLNYTGIGTQFLDYVVDRNVHKQGKYMPGVRLAIRPPEALLEDQPDYLLLLAWNFRDEIVSQQADYARRGGKFIVPVPEPAVI